MTDLRYNRLRNGLCDVLRNGFGFLCKSVGFLCKFVSLCGHGFRCFPPPGTSPDGVAAAVAAHIGPAAIRVEQENRGYMVTDLQRYGVVVSPIVLLRLRTRIREMRHVLSGQRQVFLVLKGGHTELDVAIKRTAGGRVHTVYLATAVPWCYGCGT
ncbi:unnamed protein product [Lampetra planeri]